VYIGGICEILMAAKEGKIKIMPSVCAILLNDRGFPFDSPEKISYETF
jgi:hypothetical protein